MTYTWTALPGGFPLAPAMQTLDAEIAAHPRFSALTNLGEIGDVRHQGQGTDSDHNPFVIGPPGSAYPGRGYVRAGDYGGDRDLLLELRAHLHALYVAHDPRLYPFGYAKGPDSLIFDWFGAGYHVDTGDEGHLHVSLNQRDGYHPSSAGWVPALDSRAPWGLLPTVAPQSEEDDMLYIRVNEDGRYYQVGSGQKVVLVGSDYAAAMSKITGRPIAKVSRAFAKRIATGQAIALGRGSVVR